MDAPFRTSKRSMGVGSAFEGRRRHQRKTPAIPAATTSARTKPRVRLTDQPPGGPPFAGAGSLDQSWAASEETGDGNGGEGGAMTCHRSR